MATYRLFDGQAGRPGGSLPALSSYSGNFFCGTAFEVSQYAWLNAFWWPVPAGGDTGGQQFALWQLTGSLGGSVVPAATVNLASGALTANQFNRVPLPAPIQLSPGIPYIAETGYAAVHGFPETKNQFGTGDPFAAGITNGPLTGYSDTTGSNEVPSGWVSQGSFGTAAANATSFIPNLGSDSSAIFWPDVEISTSAPAGAGYRIRPAQPKPANTFQDTATPFTLAVEFSISVPCTYKHWFFTPSGAVLLPNQVAIYNQAAQTVVAGTLNNAPSWSGAAGSNQWVSCNGLVTLPAGTYRAAVCSGPASTVWNLAVNDYWGGGGPASAGITNGPLSAPGEATAGTPGQASYNAGATIAWPGTYNAPGNGSDYLVDVEVFPAASGPMPVMASYI